MFKYNLIMGFLAPSITDIEAHNCKMNITINLVKTELYLD